MNPPMITYIAIPFPLPQPIRERLALAAKDGTEELDQYIAGLRKLLGETVTRPEILPAHTYTNEGRAT